MLWHLIIALKDFHLNNGKALAFEWQVQKIPCVQNWSLYVFASGVELPDWILNLAWSCKVVHWQTELAWCIIIDFFLQHALPWCKSKWSPKIFHIPETMRWVREAQDEFVWPVALCQKVLLMLCTSFWQPTLQRACIEDWKLIGASPAWCQVCSFMIFKHITQTLKYGNAKSFKWPWWAQLHFYEFAVEGCRYGMLRC